eukprot:1347064-Ditylum_brightwellii.AAC.1
MPEANFTCYRNLTRNKQRYQRLKIGSKQQQLHIKLRSNLLVKKQEKPFMQNEDDTKRMIARKMKRSVNNWKLKMSTQQYTGTWAMPVGTPD